MSDSSSSLDSQESLDDAEKTQKKKWYMPKYYYWGRSPPKPGAVYTYRNPQQKRFVRIMVALRLAKVAAIVLIFLLLIARL